MMEDSSSMVFVEDNKDIADSWGAGLEDIAAGA